MYGNTGTLIQNNEYCSCVILNCLFFSVPDLVLCGFGAILCIIFVIFFKCDFKRLRTEQNMAAECILNNERFQPPGENRSGLRQGVQDGERMYAEWAESVQSDISSGHNTAGQDSSPIGSARTNRPR